MVGTRSQTSKMTSFEFVSKKIKDSKLNIELKDIFSVFLDLFKTLNHDRDSRVTKIDQLFKEQMGKTSIQIEEMHTNLVEKLENKSKEVVSLKNQLVLLEKKVVKLEYGLDSQDQYERKDSVILSGPALPDVKERENCHEIVSQLVKNHLNIEVQPKDISVTHRLGHKNQTQASASKRNIYIKLCRRDLKKEIIIASKKQKKPLLFCSESLSPVRRTLFFTLRRLKRDHPEIVKGCTTMEGRVFAFTPPVRGGAKDQRHHITNMEDLRDFCRTYVKIALDDFLAQVSA